jgi:hypothetical protein
MRDGKSKTREAWLQRGLREGERGGNRDQQALHGLMKA